MKQTETSTSGHLDFRFQARLDERLTKYLHPTFLTPDPPGYTPKKDGDKNLRFEACDEIT